MRTLQLLGLTYAVAAVALALPGDDRELINQAADARPMPVATGDALSAEEQQARNDLMLSQSRLELVLARRAMKQGAFGEAAERGGTG